MGVVYRARDERLGRDVAVKVIPSELASDKERLRRFQIEARAAGQLNHPNIVIIHDLAPPRAPLHRLRDARRETLRPTLERGPCRPGARCARDPDRARPRVGAFGGDRSSGPEAREPVPEPERRPQDPRLRHREALPVGRAAGDETASVLPGLTRTGTILGTASYMAPEQIREQTIDQRTDLFAFGAILYEMLTGEKAFPGATPADRMSAILNKETPPLPREVESEVSGIGRIVSRCLEKRPEDRFQTATDLGSRSSSSWDSSRRRRRPRRPPRRRPSFPGERVTYREGTSGARFAPDGQSVIYGAALESNPLRLYWSYRGVRKRAASASQAPISCPCPP